MLVNRQQGDCPRGFGRSRPARAAPWECGDWAPPCSRLRNGGRKQVLLMRVSETADRRSEGVWAAPGEESSGGFTPPCGAAPSGERSGGFTPPSGMLTPSPAANGKQTIYGYDDADRLTSVTDAAGNVTIYGYDTENNLVDITDAANHDTHFTYDAMNNLLSKTDRKQQTIGYGYDALYRLTRKREQMGSGTVILPLPEREYKQGSARQRSPAKSEVLRQAWLILGTERSSPCGLSVRQVARQAWAGVIPLTMP